MTIQEAITEARALVSKHLEMAEHALTLPSPHQNEREQRQSIRREIARFHNIDKQLALLQPPEQYEEQDDE